MGQFFRFESDFVESLRCIPMQVRYKLDTCGVKLKLSQWHHFEPGDRQELVDRPCETATEAKLYHDFLHQLILSRTGTVATDLAVDPRPAWFDVTVIPDSVAEKAKDVEVVLTLDQWIKLSPLQRFALIKLSRSGHENSNFLPALKEFHIA